MRTSTAAAAAAAAAQQTDSVQQVLGWLDAKNPAIRTEATRILYESSEIFIGAAPILIKDHLEVASKTLNAYSFEDKAIVIASLAGLDDKDVRTFVSTALKEFGTIGRFPEELAKAAAKAPDAAAVEAALKNVCVALEPEQIPGFLGNTKHQLCVRTVKAVIEEKPVKFIGTVLEAALENPQKGTIEFISGALMKSAEGREELVAALMKFAAGAKSDRTALAEERETSSDLRGRLSSAESTNRSYQESFNSGAAYFKSQKELDDEHAEMLHRMTRD